MINKTPIDHDVAPGWEYTFARALAGFLDERGISPTLGRRFIEVAQGRTNTQIADHNGLSRNTVKTQVSHLLRRLDLRSRHQIRPAIVAARQVAKEGGSIIEIKGRLKLHLQI